MLVDDSISRGGSIMASSAPGERGGHISLLDLPMERDGRELRPPTRPLHRQPQQSHAQLTTNSQQRCRHFHASKSLASFLLLLQWTTPPLHCSSAWSVVTAAWLSVPRQTQRQERLPSNSNSTRRLRESDSHSHDRTPSKLLRMAK